MTFYRDQQILFDGDCLLYRRADNVNPVWQMRLKVDGVKGYVIRSSKTKDYAKAVVAAKKQLDALNRKVAAGIPIKDWTFARHWEDWFRRKKTVGAWTPTREKWHAGYYERYFKPYFGDKRLTELTHEFADDYWVWRINFWQSTTGKALAKSNPRRRNAKGRATSNAKARPARKTLLMEQSALNEIFADALRSSRTQKVFRLKVPRGPREDTRRPAFEENEWKVLVQHLEDWSAAKGAYADDRLNKYHRRQRQQLLCYVWFLATSGLRVGEAKKLRWENINTFTDHKGDRFLCIDVPAATKTGAREVFPMNGAAPYLRKWKRQCHPKSQDLVWSGQRRKNEPDQQPLTDANKTFQAFLKRVPYKGRPNGLLDDADGKRRTLYSLRHTYATMALLSGLLTELELARNMGTSVSQIEKHYSHVKNHHRAAALTTMTLPGYDPEDSAESAWQIDFAATKRRRTQAKVRRKTVASPINFERVQALFKVAEARKKLLPFIDTPSGGLPD